MKNCSNCRNIIDSSVDYCPFCGEPVSAKAKKVNKLKENAIRLETINKLVTVIEDEETLKKIQKLVSSFDK